MSEVIPSALDRIRASKDWKVAALLIEHLRRTNTRLSPAGEIACAIDRPKKQVYGIIKLARRYLALTSGEAIPNSRSNGYWISSRPRDLLFESVKSGDRAEGHLASEASNFERIDRDALKSTEDVELYLAQQTRIVLGKARLDMTARVAPALKRLERNRLLAEAAHGDALTPWKALGLDDPDGKSN